MRLDQYLFDKGFFSSRAKAKEAICSGKVMLEDKICLKPALSVSEKANVKVKGSVYHYVSRAGGKLEAALDYFSVNTRGSLCLDIGSSTGGFTQVLLKREAKEVYAVDVGMGQMHKSLVHDIRIHLFENTDIRDFELPKGIRVDLLVADVSFISLRKIATLFKKFTHKDSELLILFKPQFEVGRSYLKKGIYKNVDIDNLLDDFISFLSKEGFKDPKIYKVPLKGKKGNQEYFVYSRSGTIMK